MTVKIHKTEEGQVEQRLVYGEVYAPNRPDAHDEYMTAETIQKMAHEFVKNQYTKKVDREHDNEVIPQVQIVESFIARKGDPDFIEGSWVVGVHVNDDDTWEAVKKGEINGFSLEAMVVRDAKEMTIEIPPVVSGLTSAHKTEKGEHTQTFYVSFDDEGNFLGGVTDKIGGHSHTIKSGTVTEEADGHSHRFSSVDGIEIID